MNTRKKLARVRETQRAEATEAEAPLPDASRRPRWKRNERDMNEMLRGVDPDRFERLADGDR